ncbi:hypothetical protein OS493_014594 [Desmophyllum pertusum]|uniref:Uncharacterized protein n=1 Tax=Desmophyllum pertusum TaxID=174260 RepID=A0A9W9YQ21_9CNID|nr:hypothetical protein OS493_014594 [Desmophyllum pertusum]
MFGASCCSKVTKNLKKRFTLSEAEDFYGVDYFEMQVLPSTPSTPPTPTSDHLPSQLGMSPIFGYSPSAKKSKLQKKAAIGDVIPRLISLFKL